MLAERVLEVKRILQLVIAVIILSSVGVTGSTSETFPPRRVITPQALRTAGVMRLSDILRMIDNWDISSIDGFTWQVNNRYLPSFQDQSWILMIDGVRIDFNRFGAKSMNALPVAVDQIDFVEVIDLPQIHEGEFTNRGLIHIHTIRPVDGVSFRGSYIAGNETGDPGPYSYTEQSSHNVDKTGPDWAWMLGLRRSGYYTRFNGLSGDHFPTDAKIFKRNRSIAGKYPKQMFAGNRLLLGKVWKNDMYELFADRSTFEDFWFFKPYGREIPVESGYTQVGLRTKSRLLRNIDLRLRLKYSRDETEAISNTANLDFGWSMDNSSANIEADYSVANSEIVFGLKLDDYSLFEKPHKRVERYLMTRIYGEVTHSCSPVMHQSVAAVVKTDGEENAIDVAMSGIWRFRPEQTLTLAISSSEELFSERNGVWYWTEHDSSFLQSDIISYSATGEFKKSRQLSSDLVWQLNSDRYSIEAGCFYNRFNGLYIEQQDFRYNPVDASFSSPVTVYTDQDGDVAGGDISIELRLNRMLKHRIYYRYTTFIAGDEVFKDVRRTIPAHKLVNVLTFQPDDRFSIQAALHRRTSTEWVDYNRAEAETDGEYSPIVDGATLLDIALQKRFWGRRVHSSMLFRNVFNARDRYHPIGAEFDLSYFIRVSVELDYLME